jgi:predicted ATPase/class 3 adenylate cyclase
MTFEELLDQAIALLQRRGRLTYRALKRQFDLDDDYLADLKAELIQGQRLAVDEDGVVLVWTGGTDVPPRTTQPASQPGAQPGASEVPRTPTLPAPIAPPSSDAERRQLTVLFCDLVDSTALASQLDPEDLRVVVRAYQAACAEVIQRFDGHIAQYLGDGLLVYFGYPQAHEDTVQRAVYSGLGMVEAMGTLNTRLEQEHGVRLAVRLGIHTGLVVVGEIGSGGRQEQLALGETPNIAARLQSLAAPDTVVISAVTAHLIQGYFVCQPLGVQVLKGLPQPLQVYRVLHESEAQTRLDVAMVRGLTPLVGRDEEVGLLQQRWDQAVAGMGQVVLLSGEAGIGKSRLVQVLKEYINSEPHTRIEWRGSPYHQQSALYPIINHLHRLLRGHHAAPPDEQLQTLEAALTASGMALSEAVPLLAALLSLPLPASYAPLTLTPQRQRQQTLEILLAWLYAEAQQQPVLLIVEDLHWLDPSTVELLSLLIDQCAPIRLCLVLTTRPGFHPPWTIVAHSTTLTLRRLTPAEIGRLVMHVVGDKTLPAAVLQEVVCKTDGVPLFVEELTKTVLASGLLEEQEDRYALHGPLPPLAIPATLHDALLARLDRLAAAKVVAQLGATIGRTFAFDVVQAVAPLDAAALQGVLAQLVEAEVVAQRGIPPQATYTFKHALIQDAAYQSLLRSTRQQYHQRIAQVLAERFLETAETQPEVVAQHYTAAGLHAEALTYWQRAGQLALERSAYREAVVCFEQALSALSYLPEQHDTREQAIDLRFNLRNVLLPLGEQERILDHLRVAATLAEAIQDQQRLGWVNIYMTSCFYNMGQADNAVRTGQYALTMAMSLRDIALQIQAAYYLGLAYHLLGHYRQAIDLLHRNVTSCEGGLVRERFGLPYLPSVFSRTWLVWCLTELGAFDEGRAIGREAIQIAEAIEQPWDLLAAYRGVGLLSLGKGEIQEAIAFFERCLELCQTWDISGWFAIIASHLGYTYALSGHMNEALPLLEQAIGQAPSKRSVYHSRLLGYLSEAYILDGRPDDALPLAVGALEMSRFRKERGFQAYALRLLGDIAARREPPDSKQAEAHYQDALALAGELGMRPLQAHCHHGLGTLYRQTGRAALARATLSTAIEMYRVMDMTFWLPVAEAALAEVE